MVLFRTEIFIQKRTNITAAQADQRCLCQMNADQWVYFGINDEITSQILFLTPFTSPSIPVVIQIQFYKSI